MTDKQNEIEADPLFTSPTAKLVIFRDNQAHENKKRAVSIRKMIKNYTETGKTNTRLLLNHIIIIQNDMGVQKTVYALRSFMEDDESIIVLNTCLLFLEYIDESDAPFNTKLKELLIEDVLDGNR